MCDSLTRWGIDRVVVIATIAMALAWIIFIVVILTL
jgi:hypothetical protein